MRKHPNLRRLANQATQPLEPLKYKLQDIPEGHNPFVPLGLKQEIPFSVVRSHAGNLPVYTSYSHNRQKKRTRIRHIYGDIDEFQMELKKIVSNAEIIPKVGRVDVKGLHTESVVLWLTRLGF